MARLPKGIFGPFSGKIGPVVGVVLNGKAYMRAAPKKRKKKKKKRKPVLQLANEAKFKYVNKWMIPFHPYIIVGFGNLNNGGLPISKAFSINYRQVVTGNYPDFGIDPAKVVLSIGSLPELNEPVMELVEPDTLELSWSKNKGAQASFDDQVILVVYSYDLALTDGFIGGVNRASKKCSFRFDEQLIGKAIDVYVSLTSLDRKRIANSVYLGRITP